MDHTYLRYECADSFGLVTSAGAATQSRAPLCDNTLQASGNLLLTTASSHCSAAATSVCWRLLQV